MDRRSCRTSGLIREGEIYKGCGCPWRHPLIVRFSPPRRVPDGLIPPRRWETSSSSTESLSQLSPCAQSSPASAFGESVPDRSRFAPPVNGSLNAAREDHHLLSHFVHAARTQLARPHRMDHDHSARQANTTEGSCQTIIAATTIVTVAAMATTAGKDDFQDICRISVPDS